MTGERRIVLMAFLAAVPAAVVALWLLWSGTYTAKLQWTLTVVILGAPAGFVAALHQRVVFPLRTLSNLLAALREGEFSLRLRGSRDGDALAEVQAEVNSLADTLREQRLGAVETTALLRKILAGIDVAVLAFDREGHLRLVNHHAERLLGDTAERLIDRNARDLGIADWLTGDTPRVVKIQLSGHACRWELHRGKFWERGLPHDLLVLSDLTRTLREEEKQAWQRLIRVLRHEVNNSLAPIHSLAQSLASLLNGAPRSEDWERDLRDGLAVIADRSKALNRFMASYARLTELPKPTLRCVDVAGWVQHVVALETRLRVAVVAGPELTIEADGDQLDQLLINLVRNAVDAALDTGGGVQVRWIQAGASPPHLELLVEDEGPGLSNAANLFVPFYTTKPSGSGIGLVLSRQIAEAHGGTLALENRPERSGCRACLRLPIDQEHIVLTRNTSPACVSGQAH